MTKDKNVFGAQLDISEQDVTKNPSAIELFKLHVGCVTPLSKAIQSMKDCYEDLQDESLKEMLIKCIEDIGKIEDVLLQRASDALKTEIVSIRKDKSSLVQEPSVDMLAGQIAGKIPLAQSQEQPVAQQAESIRDEKQS